MRSMFSWLKHLWYRVVYCWWVFTGHAKFELELCAAVDHLHNQQKELFNCLAKDVQENRKLISELRQAIYAIDDRLWELEGHTPEETFRRLKQKMEGFQHRAKELAATFGESNEASQA